MNRTSHISMVHRVQVKVLSDWANPGAGDDVEPYGCAGGGMRAPCWCLFYGGLNWRVGNMQWLESRDAHLERVTNFDATEREGLRYHT